MMPDLPLTPCSAPALFPTPPAPWIGWIRRPTAQTAGRWRPAVDGQTERECSDKLFAMLTGTTGSASTTILPAGEKP
jgi:hypothetical protein